MAYNWTNPIQTNLPVGTHELTHEEVPAACFSATGLQSLEWCSEKIILPSDPHGSLFNLRAQDIPEPQRVKKPKTPWSSSKCPGSLVITQGNKAKSIVFGTGATLADMADGRLRFAINRSSQLPSLLIDFRQEISAGVLQGHRVVFNGDTSMQGVAYHDPHSVKSPSFAVHIPADLREAATEGRVLGVTIQFGNSAPKQRDSNSVTVLHDLQTPSESDRWGSNEDMVGCLNQAEPRGTFDQACWQMYRAKNTSFTFLRAITAEDMKMLPALEFEYQHWVQVMRLAIEHGPFWFYRMQLPNQLRSQHAAHPPIPVPF